MVFLKKKHPITTRIFQVLLEKGFERTYTNKIYQKDDTLHVNLHLPENKELADLEKILPNLQQEVAATAMKLGKVSGKNVEILFGMKKLGKFLFSKKLLTADSLKVTFPSAYGSQILDFEDGASCHVLNGGVTRMGKTVFLLYVATSIFLQNDGNVQLYISSAKLKDYYPFQDIPNVKMAKNDSQTQQLLVSILNEYRLRNELLYSPQLRKATDAKSIRELYPEHYHQFQPIFLIIDEYARFADNKMIQDAVTEIVETAGFVNIHVVIASQRPDASTVLKSRIRANLLTRIAFTTADKKNSEIILDREGAENLGKIAGRALLLDGELTTIQVPLLETGECDKLLEPYRVERVDVDEQETERGINHECADKIQGLLKESCSIPGLPNEQQSDQCSEPSPETNVVEWSHFTDTKGT